MPVDPQANAFPVEGCHFYSHGLTIRAHFAAMAMQGIISQACDPITDEEVAKRAVWCADALIAELNK